MTISLNAGNIWTHEYLDKVIEWNKEFKDTIQVKSLFGSISGLTPTARSADRIPFLEWSMIDRYVDKARKNDIAVRYTLNQSCIGSIQEFKRDWDTKLEGDIVELHNIGVREWTVTSPLLVELLRELFPDDFIEVSTIAEVATAEEARRWLAIGADGVNLSTSINRNFRAIDGVSATGIKVSVLANEACLFKCPWRRECYNLSSHNSQRSEELFGFYPFRKCNELRMAKPVEWVKSRLLLPQWMKLYQDLAQVDWFKIAYRTHPAEVALPILRMYMEQDFHGNLLSLWPTISQLGHTSEPEDQTYIHVDGLEDAGFFLYFMKSGYICDENICDRCGYCQRIYDGVKKVGTK